jgi:hypothetical protein
MTSRCAALGLFALLGCGAHHRPDPLDPVVLDELAGQRGDAVGTDWSGDYACTLELVSCGCPVLEIEENGMPIDYDPCTLVDVDMGGGEVLVPLLQTDGIVVLTLPDLGQLTGPIDADGSFSAAARLVLDSVLLEHELLTRADGELYEDRGDAALSGRLRQRFLATVGEQRVDCVAELDVEGIRVDP